VRALILGISLGMGAFILTTLLKFQLVTLLATTIGSSDSIFMWAAMRLGVEQMGTLVVAPVIAYGAGLLLTGPRWAIVTSQILAFQLTSVAVLAGPLGLEAFASPLEIGLLVSFTIIGIVLSGVAMKRGQTSAEKKEKAAPPPPRPAPLSAIDFSQVKPEEPAAVVAPTEPAAPTTPAAPPAPAAPAEPAAPAASPGVEPKP